MTTLAYDGRLLAADMQHTFGHSARLQRPRSKIFKVRQSHRRFVAATSGTEVGALMLLAWYLNTPETVAGKEVGAPIQDESQQGSLIVVELLPDKSHKAAHITYNGAVYDITGDHYASGSGAEYAEGAMAAGASAASAVEIASRYDVFSGMGVEVVDLLNHPAHAELFNKL